MKHDNAAEALRGHHCEDGELENWMERCLPKPFYVSEDPLD
jgi:hypothetical protein